MLAPETTMGRRSVRDPQVGEDVSEHLGIWEQFARSLFRSMSTGV